MFRERSDVKAGIQILLYTVQPNSLSLPTPRILREGEGGVIGEDERRGTELPAELF